MFIYLISGLETKKQDKNNWILTYAIQFFKDMCSSINRCMCAKHTYCNQTHYVLCFMTLNQHENSLERYLNVFVLHGSELL